jgi:hypothetical protein
MYLCITVNHDKFVLASSVKAFTDETSIFTDNANNSLFGLRTTYVDIIREFALLPSTGNGPYTASKQSQDGTQFHPDSKTCMKLTSAECTVENS